MKALIVYGSVYGNTEKIAQAIASGLGEKGEARLVRAGKENVDLQGVDLLVVGSPTQGGRPTPPVQEFLKAIPSNGLQNIRVASFDTRMRKGGSGAFAKLFGYAADRIESEMKKRGGTVIASEGFGVKGREGPLEEGETDRAQKWGSGLVG
jgi:flavodoxin